MKMFLTVEVNSQEKAKAAFESGADAVSFGLGCYGRLSGFDGIESLRSLGIAQSKKLEGRFDSYFHEKDLEALESFISSIEGIPFSVFSISDIGIIEIVKKHFPEAEICLSSFANITNSGACQTLRSIGVDRITLGREASLTDIRAITETEGAPQVELYVHGPVSMVYSGRSLISTYLEKTGSQINAEGNYSLALEEESRKDMYFPFTEEQGEINIQSSQDLCLLGKTQILIQSGVSHFRITGAMRDVSYIRDCTGIYRKALDENPGDLVSYRRILRSYSQCGMNTGFCFSSSAIEPGSKTMS